MKIDDDLEAEFDQEKDYVLMGGYRYYLWEFKDTNPDFDIIGKVKNASFHTRINDEIKRKLHYLNTHYEELGIIMFCTFLIFVIVLLYLLDIKQRERTPQISPQNIPLEKRTKLKILAFYAGFVVFSFLLTFYITFLIGLWINRKDKKHYLRQVIVFLALIGFAKLVLWALT